MYILILFLLFDYIHAQAVGCIDGGTGACLVNNTLGCATVNYGGISLYTQSLIACSDDSDCNKFTECQYYCRYFPLDFSPAAGPQHDGISYLLSLANPERPLYSSSQQAINRDIWQFSKVNRVCQPFAHICDLGDDAACNIEPPFPYMTGSCKALPASYVPPGNNATATDCIYDNECKSDVDCNNIAQECIFVQTARKRICVPKAYNVKPTENTYNSDLLGDQEGTLETVSIPSCNVDIDCALQPKTSRDECKMTWATDFTWYDSSGVPFSVAEYNEIMYQYLFLGTRNWFNLDFALSKEIPNTITENSDIEWIRCANNIYKGVDGTGYSGDGCGLRVKDECSFTSLLSSYDDGTPDYPAYHNSQYAPFYEPQAFGSAFVSNLQNNRLTPAAEFAYGGSSGTSQSTNPNFCIFDDETISRKCISSYGVDRGVHGYEAGTNVPVTIADAVLVSSTFPSAADSTKAALQTAMQTAYNIVLAHNAIENSNQGSYAASGSTTNVPPDNRAVPWLFSSVTSDDLGTWTDDVIIGDATYLRWLGAGIALADSGLYCRMNPYLAYRTCSRSDNSCSAANVGTSIGCPSSNMICTQFYHTNEAPNYIATTVPYYDCIRPDECTKDSQCSGGQKCTLQAIGIGQFAPYTTCSCQVGATIDGCGTGSKCFPLTNVTQVFPTFFTSYAPKLSPFSNVCLCDPSSSTQFCKLNGRCSHNSGLGLNVCQSCQVTPGSVGNLYDCSTTTYSCTSTSGYLTSTGVQVLDNLHTAVASLNIISIVYKDTVITGNGTVANVTYPGSIGPTIVFLNLTCVCPSSPHVDYTYIDIAGYCQPYYKNVLCGATGATFNLTTGRCSCSQTTQPSTYTLSTSVSPVCKYTCPLWTAPTPTSQEIPNQQVCGGSDRSQTPPCQSRSDDLGNMCVCKNGFAGAACSHTLCPMGIANKQCSNNGFCDTATGRCVCANNYIGFSCEVLYVSTTPLIIPSQVLPYYG